MAAAGQQGQSSSESKTTLILTGLIGRLQTESTCDYIPVIYGLISVIRSQLTPVSLSLSIHFALRSFKPFLLCPSDPKFLHSVSAATRGLSEESVNSRPLHQDKNHLIDGQKEHAKVSYHVFCFFFFLMMFVKYFI